MLYLLLNGIIAEVLVISIWLYSTLCMVSEQMSKVGWQAADGFMEDPDYADSHLLRMSDLNHLRAIIEINDTGWC